MFVSQECSPEHNLIWCNLAATLFVISLGYIVAYVCVCASYGWKNAPQVAWNLQRGDRRILFSDYKSMNERHLVSASCILLFLPIIVSDFSLLSHRGNKSLFFQKLYLCGAVEFFALFHRRSLDDRWSYQLGSMRYIVAALKLHYLHKIIVLCKVKHLACRLG